MNAILNELAEPKVIQSGITELVRGNDQPFVDRIAPMLCEHSIALDLRSVERIDAAGIAALIKLYGKARDVGRQFSVCNVSAHVGEILGLVGLAPVLVSQHVVQNSHTDVPCEYHAA